MLDFVEARAEHLPRLAERLRPEDSDELLATTGIRPLAALSYSLHASLHAWVWNIDGEPACIFGIAAPSLISESGMPWLMTTHAIERRPLAFLRNSRRALAHMLQLHPRLEGYVDARYVVSVRWLRWLGFTIHAVERMGPLHTPFHRFEREREAWPHSR